MPKTLAALREAAVNAADGARLLRIYWYDGVLRTGMLTADQQILANSSRTKLRLGLVNSQGEQKGVDSLIVIDLIDLARNKAISDALVMSGDEDIRVGVQIAQNFGLQIHLLGIKPARGSQSPDLIQEADTHQEWQDSDVRAFMAVEPKPSPVIPPATTASLTVLPLPAIPFYDAVSRSIAETFDQLGQADIERIRTAYVENPQMVPQDLDRPALGRLAMLLGRQLDNQERKAFRQVLRGELAAESPD